MRRVLIGCVTTTAVLGAAVVVYVASTLPAPAARLSGEWPATSVLGAYHVHSSRSDGTGSVDDIAAAAARAGVSFVILTDHGDGTREPDAPAYRHGVLCIDAVEVNTFSGHVVALNLGHPSAYPLAGETADVVEDIHRLGGWAVAAHPDSPRAGLRWPPGEMDFDGVEWLNADSEWRRLSAVSLAGTAIRSFVRGPETLAEGLDRPDRSLRRWDAALRLHPVFTLAGLDAHARLGFDDQAPARGVAIARPTYEAMFRTLGQVALLDQPLTGRADADAAAVLRALGAGRSYSIVRGIAGPADLRFTATRGSASAAMGESLPPGDGNVIVHASVPAASDSRIVLLRDGAVVREGQGRVDYDVGPAAGAYRVEVYYGSHPVPWLASNAVRVGLDPTPPTRPRSPEDTGTPVLLPVAVVPAAWSIERDPASRGTLAASDGQVDLEYVLGAGLPAGQYVAIATHASGDDALDRIEFTAAASAPMRLSVQIRLPGGANGRRWRRSVYLDPTPRRVSVRVADLEPVDSGSLRPIRARVQSVLLVVDTLNARPGMQGRITLNDVVLLVARDAAAGPRPSGSN